MSSTAANRLVLIPPGDDDLAAVDDGESPSLRDGIDSRERIRRNTLERAALEVGECAGLCHSRNWRPGETAGTMLPFVRERLHELCDRLQEVRKGLESERDAGALMSPAEASEYYGVSVPQLKREAESMAAGGLAIRIGKQWRFKKF
jgi:hypothetical protein